MLNVQVGSLTGKQSNEFEGGEFMIVK